jgi:hypothetical protein
VLGATLYAVNLIFNTFSSVSSSFSTYSGGCLKLYCMCFAAGYVKTIVCFLSLSSHWTTKKHFLLLLLIQKSKGTTMG